MSDNNKSNLSKLLIGIAATVIGGLILAYVQSDTKHPAPSDPHNSGDLAKILSGIWTVKQNQDLQHWEIVFNDGGISIWQIQNPQTPKTDWSKNQITVSDLKIEENRLSFKTSVSNASQSVATAYNLMIVDQNDLRGTFQSTDAANSAVNGIVTMQKQ